MFILNISEVPLNIHLPVSTAATHFNQPKHPCQTLFASNLLSRTFSAVKCSSPHCVKCTPCKKINNTKSTASKHPSISCGCYCNKIKTQAVTKVQSGLLSLGSLEIIANTKIKSLFLLSLITYSVKLLHKTTYFWHTSCNL